eukprot:scaffold171415_cov33-Tisochrysis_lutea.AAC.4
MSLIGHTLDGPYGWITPRVGHPLVGSLRVWSSWQLPGSQPPRPSVVVMCERAAAEEAGIAGSARGWAEEARA